MCRWNGDLVRFLYFVCGSESLSEVHRYISTGNGKGNPYGLAITMGVVAPFLFFGRLYWSGPPMTNIIFFVTIVLVSVIFPWLRINLMLRSLSQIVGYSWQNTHIPIGFNYWGWPLAWVGQPTLRHPSMLTVPDSQRRFILVVCGVTAAL